jgi:SAM-dependent methyltransferase
MQKIYSHTHKIISNLRSSDYDIEDYELEYRFGTKINNKFNPNIKKELFDEIFKLIYKNNSQIVENAFIHDKHFDCGIERRTKNVENLMFETKNYIIFQEDQNVIVTYIKKEKINQYTDDYLRLSFNKEEKLSQISDTNLKFQRMKYRLSLLVNEIFRFDFTIINDKDYSVEIEILLKNIKSIEHFETKHKEIVEMLFPIIKKMEVNIFNNINPPQPHSLNYSDLFIIASSNYTVTEKADGIRTFLKIHNNTAYLINPRTHKPIRSLGNINLGNTLIDGEYVNERFFAFDLMYYNNKDYRDKNFLERLKILQENIHNIKIGLYIKVKKFYMKNIFENGAKILQERHPYKIDGLIFTPIYQSYNSDELPIFKWKKRETIDVRVKYIRKDDFTYFIFGKKYGRINEWSPEYYERNYARPRDYRTKQMQKMFHYQEYQELKNRKIHFGKYKHFNSKLFNTPFLGKKGKPNEDPQTREKLNKNLDTIMDKYDIIEYEYRNGEWYPLRKRTFDKYEANAIRTIDGVLKVIEEDITIEKMIDFQKKYKIKNEEMSQVYNHVAQDHAFKRDNWRNFHNYVKRKTIINASNSVSNHSSYLDLACGKGGDIGKYTRLNYKNILAIDSSEIELYGKNGYIHRLTNLGFVDKDLYFEKDGVKVTVLCGDISLPIRTGEFLKNKDDLPKLKDFFLRENKIDTISIMFAIHYMFGNFHHEEWNNDKDKINGFFENMVDLIKPDGKFVGTYLNFDEEKVEDKYVFDHHTIPFYKIVRKDNYLQVQTEVWGWENKLSEPLMNYQKLNEIMERYGFVEIENNSFETHYDSFKTYEGIILTKDEKSLAFMNNYFTYIMSPQVIKKSIKLN